MVTVGQVQQSLGPFKSSWTSPSPTAPPMRTVETPRGIQPVLKHCWLVANTTESSFEVYESLTEEPWGLSDLQSTDTG